MALFQYMMQANSGHDSLSVGTVIENAPTTPCYLVRGVTYTGSDTDNPNISLYAEGARVITNALEKVYGGVTYICGGTYTVAPKFQTANGDSEIVTVIDDGDFTGSVYFGKWSGNGKSEVRTSVNDGVFNGTVFCGSQTGVDGKIITTVTDGKVVKHLYGGGKVSAESTELTVAGGTVGQDVYGGLLIKTTNAILIGENNLTVSGGTFKQYVVGGCRITTADTTTTHTVRKVTVILTGGDFAYTGTSTAPGAMIFGSGYVQGYNNTAAVNAQYQVNESHVTVATNITGAVYGGVFVSKFGLAQVDEANITVSSGSVDRVFGGGWAQTNGICNVGNVNILIENGAEVDTIYVGGGNDSTGRTEITGEVDITVTDTSVVKNIFMGGQHNKSLVSGNVTVTISGEAKTFDRISGNGQNLVNTGISELVVDTIANIVMLDNIDNLVIKEGNTLTISSTMILPNSGMVVNLDMIETFSANESWIVIQGDALTSDLVNAMQFRLGDTVLAPNVADENTGYGIVWDETNKTVTYCKIIP